MQRMAAIIADIEGVETSGRNMDRDPDTRMPCAIVFDGDEDVFENLSATGGATNIVNMTPVVVVSLGDVPENIGTVMNEWLAKVQKAVLLDAELDSLSCGRSASKRIPNGGARYVGKNNTQHEGRTTEVTLSVHFSIAYPLIPSEL